jgi:hypothetical protein
VEVKKGISVEGIGAGSALGEEQEERMKMKDERRMLTTER